MPTEQQITALERLNALRENGTLTTEEFDREKAKILAGPSINTVPFYRRLWFVVLLTCLILTFPIAMLILLTGDVYKRRNGVPLEPISSKARYIYAGALGIWLVAVAVKSFVKPDSWENNDPNAGKASAMSSATSPTKTATVKPAVPPGEKSSSNDGFYGAIDRDNPGHVIASDQSCLDLDVKAHTNYSVTYGRIVGAGFTPSAPPPGEGRSCYADDCKDHAEIEDCSGSGFCKAHFQNAVGSKIEMTLFVDESVIGSTVEVLEKTCK